MASGGKGVVHSGLRTLGLFGYPSRGITSQKRSLQGCLSQALRRKPLVDPSHRWRSRSCRRVAIISHVYDPQGYFLFSACTPTNTPEAIIPVSCQFSLLGLLSVLTMGNHAHHGALVNEPADLVNRALSCIPNFISMLDARIDTRAGEPRLHTLPPGSQVQHCVTVCTCVFVNEIV